MGEGSSKKDVTKCAAWDRVSSGLLSPLLGSYGVVHYYVYQIVDGKGRRVQPYYDAYMRHARSTCRPPFRHSLQFLGLEQPHNSSCPLAFRGVRQSRDAAGG